MTAPFRTLADCPKCRESVTDARRRYQTHCIAGSRADEAVWRPMMQVTCPSCGYEQWEECADHIPTPQEAAQAEVDEVAP